MTKPSDSDLVALFLRTLRTQEVSGWRRIEEVTGVPRNTYYRMERGETTRLNLSTRAKIEHWLGLVGALEGGVVVPVGDPVDELIRALSHPAVRGFLGALGPSDRVHAALAYAEARGFTPEQKARIHRWAANELAILKVDDSPTTEPAISHNSR